MAGDFWSIGISFESLADCSICSGVEFFGYEFVGCYFTFRYFFAEVVDFILEFHF